MPFRGFRADRIASPRLIAGCRFVHGPLQIGQLRTERHQFVFDRHDLTSQRRYVAHE